MTITIVQQDAVCRIWHAEKGTLPLLVARAQDRCSSDRHAGMQAWDATRLESQQIRQELAAALACSCLQGEDFPWVEPQEP
jgi:hypothetical protein